MIQTYNKNSNFVDLYDNDVHCLQQSIDEMLKK